VAPTSPTWVSGDADWYELAARVAPRGGGPASTSSPTHIYDSSGNRGVTLEARRASTLFGGPPRASGGNVAPLGQGGPREHRLDEQARSGSPRPAGSRSRGGGSRGRRATTRGCSATGSPARSGARAWLAKALPFYELKDSARPPAARPGGSCVPNGSPQAGLRRLPGVRPPGTEPGSPGAAAPSPLRIFPRTCDTVPPGSSRSVPGRRAPVFSGRWRGPPG